jgi:serine/threonine-protein kinase
MNAVVSVEAATPKACPSCGKRYPADALFCSLDGAPLTTSPGAIAAAAASDPYVGREILGHIEIRQLVGIGAMGRVYRAFQKGIDRDVAVKILHRELSANPTLVSRFNREAKVASRLAHPNVVQVLLVGQLPDGAMYIVMEYLDGMSLQSALAACGGAMPLPRALHIALQLCDAAGEGHAQGIVHRDVKPENVMLVRRADDPDYVKVLDFGIARINWGEQSMSTAAGLIFGTARYISPEGAQGERVGPQGDVYSIATMIYQMLSGRAPFDGEQAVALLVQQIHDPPPPLTSIPRASYVPQPIADVVMANLAKKPGDRAENARAFGRSLLDAAVASGLSAQDILARPALATGGRGPQASVVQMAPMQRTKQHEVEPEVAQRIGGRVGASKTSLEEPTPHVRGRTMVRTEIPEAEPVAPGAATTKWTPPADFEAKLVPPPPTSGVDATMDDQHAMAVLPAPSRAPASRAVPPPLPPSASVEIAPQPPRSSVPTGPPAVPRGPQASAPGPTLPGALSPERRPPFRPKSVALVVGSLVVGIAIAVASFRAGTGGHLSPLETFVARANDARSHQRWDEPPGDNVRDITDDGLSRWPRDPKLVHVRQAASEDLVKAASAKHEEGDQIAAVHLARVAAQLDPSSMAARDLLATWAPPEQSVAPADLSVPPLAIGRAANSMATGSGSSSTNGARATLDASNAKPGVGQPVDFTARVLGAGGAKPKVDGAHFRVMGPGLPGNQIDAVDDGTGVYRTTFTPMQSGRFEMSFIARADGSAVRSARTLLVGLVGGDKPGGKEPGPSTAGGTAAAAASAATPAPQPTQAPPPPTPSAAPPANNGKFI